jgi:hypothetical protein
VSKGGELVALIALTEVKLGGRKYPQGKAFVVPQKVALKLIGTGEAQRASMADGRHRRK